LGPAERKVASAGPPRDRPEDPASAADCARAVTDALSADHSLTTVKIVVVAHSISGLFLPQVVTYGRVSQLVYLAAAVPKPGMSFRQQFDASPDMYNAEWIAMGAKISSDERVATHFLYHDCSPAVIRKALAERIEFRASKLWTEPFALAEHPAIDTRYIVCGLDRTFTPTWMKRAARQTLAVEPLEMRTGHCPYLSKPQALASLLALGGEHSRIRPTKVSHDQ